MGTVQQERDKNKIKREKKRNENKRLLHDKSLVGTKLTSGVINEVRQAESFLLD